jgi:hypothetical protein
MAIVGYGSISEALASIKVSYVLELNNHASGDYYNVKVLAPLYKDKEYYLPQSYSLSYTDVHRDVLQNLAKRYGIGVGTFYYIH